MKTFEVVFTVDGIRHVLLIDGLDKDDVEVVFFDAYIQDYFGIVKLISVKEFQTGKN